VKETLSASDARDLVESLLADYVQCIDDDDLEKWPDFFTDPCLYRVVSRDSYERDLPVAVIHCDSQGMLKDRVFSLRHANIYAKHHYRHFLGRTQVRSVSENGVVEARTNYQVIRTLSGGATDLFSVGVYLDRVAVVEGAARFHEKLVVYENSSFETLLATPL
jgi:anthranilate 1,2-dioxygenase small subunit